MDPIVVLIAVGLSPRHLQDPALAAATPTLRALAAAGGFGPLATITPAVTMAAQATLLTGAPPDQHGVVGNGWHFRDTDEIRFWQQSRNLLTGPLLYETARKRAAARGLGPFTVAKLFGWFNQASRVDLALTPKPYYGSDGNKAFAIHGKPAAFVADTETALGRFPFAAFWGPMSGRASTDWIAAATARTLTAHRPTLTWTYLPHLDYPLQKLGPRGPHLAPALRILDDAVSAIHTAAQSAGARLVVVSEYGIGAVDRCVTLNRTLRREGLLTVRDGPFGETIDVPDTPAVAVADHQIAHISVADPARIDEVAALVRAQPGVDQVYVGDARAEVGLDHPRAGAIVAIAAPDAWFGYEYWLDPRRAPDFARTIDIHRKPGYDPQEMFFDPRLRAPKLRAARRLLAKRLGFRMRMDVVPIDRPDLVRGSHGRPSGDPADGAILLTDDPQLAATLPTHQLGVHDWLLHGLGLGLGAGD